MTTFEGFFYYACPLDNIYSGEMKLIRTNKTITIFELFEIKQRGLPKELEGKRLRCPKCKKTYGWHQLKKVRR